MRNKEEPEVNLEQILESVRGFFGKNSPGGGNAGILIFVVIQNIFFNQFFTKSIV